MIATRLAAASQELRHYREFDYLVVNDQFDTALAELRAIITAQRLCVASQQQRHAALLASLVGAEPGAT